MSAMVKLDVSGIVYGTVSSLTDGCVQSLVKNWQTNLDGFECLPTHLKDKCIYLMSKRGWLSDSNIGKLLHDKVKVLDLADCEIGNEGLAAMCRCKQLQKIDLNANKESRTNISSEAIHNLAKSCRYLQTVYLRRCLNLMDEAVITLSRSCPQLRLLNLGGCQKITDSSLQALGEHCKFLKSINVSNTQEVHLNHCKHVTDEAVEAVLQYCPQINILLFHGCPKVTEQSRQALEDLTLSRASPMKQVTWTIY